MLLGGVQPLAEEVGVAPELVRAAAGSLRTNPPVGGGVDSRPPNRGNPWISGHTRLVFERVVDGELPEGEYETLVDEIRLFMEDGGQVSQFGRSFTWTTARPGQHSGVRRNLEVTVSIRTGRARILVQENLTNMIGGVFGGIGGGMGGGGMGPMLGIMGGVLHLGPPGVAIVPVWLSITNGTAREGHRRVTAQTAAGHAAL